MRQERKFGPRSQRTFKNRLKSLDLIPKGSRACVCFPCPRATENVQLGWTVTGGHLPSADKVSPSGTSLWKRAQGHLQQAPAMRGRGQLCDPVGCPPGTLKPQVGGPHSVGGAWLKAQATLPLTSQPGVCGVRALTSSPPPGINSGLAQTEARVLSGCEL